MPSVPLSPVNPQVAVTPNAVLVPQIALSTRIVNGALKTSALITLQPAAVDGSGKWTVAGAAVPLALPDMANLPADLAGVAAEIAAAEASLLAAINAVNGIRKLV